MYHITDSIHDQKPSLIYWSVDEAVVTTMNQIVGGI